MHVKRQCFAPLILLILGFEVVFADVASAEHRIGVSPARVQLPAEAGDVISGEIEVINAGTEPFGVEASVTSWTVNERGERVWQDLTAEQRGANLWTNLAPVKFRLTRDWA